MSPEFKIEALHDIPQTKDRAAKWFHSKWGVPLVAYIESMDACLGWMTAASERCISSQTTPHFTSVTVGNVSALLSVTARMPSRASMCTAKAGRATQISENCILFCDNLLTFRKKPV